MGGSRGTRMIMEALPSMNMPTISRNTLQNSRKMYLLEMLEIIQLVSAWGICSLVSTQE